MQDLQPGQQAGFAFSPAGNFCIQEPGGQNLHFKSVQNLHVFRVQKLHVILLTTLLTT